MRGPNYVKEWFDITPNAMTNNYSYGGIIYFDIDKRADMLGDIILILTRGQPGNLGGATFAFNDFEAYSSIDYIRFYYSTKQFHEIYGEELMRKYYQRPKEQRDMIAQLQYGGRTEIERIANGSGNSSGYTWVCNLFVPW